MPTTNVGGQEAVALVEGLTQIGEAAAEAAIIADFPVMGTPVLKTIWEGLLDWIVAQIAVPLAALSGKIVIELEEYVSLKSAISAQAALDAAKKTGNVNAIEVASKNVDQAIAGAIRYVGTFHT